MDLKEIQERLEVLPKKKGALVNFNKAGSSVGSPTQGLQERLRAMFKNVLPDYDFSRLLVMDVGDRTQSGAENGGYDIAMSLPVASDTWYLTVGASILPFQGENYQENAAKILSFLTAYLARLDNIKPLKSLQSYKDISTWFNAHDMRISFDTDHAPHVIREMRFEMWMLNRSTEFPSKGPKASIEAGVKSTPTTSLGQLYAGFVSFPVGPLGVMEVLSIFSESMDGMLQDKIPFTVDGTVRIENPDGWKCVTDQPLEGLMSPMTDMKGVCPGVHLVEKGYMTVSRDAEYPSEPFAGYDSILPLYPLRYYLRRDAKWPLPGEFIGLLAKPWPTHVWWFQETSPLLYSGNWFETNHYTSGIVKEALQPPEGSFGLAYKCVVRGVEVCASSSDFYQYAIGDRVAIIRLNDLDRFLDQTRGNFKWKEMEDLIAREKMDKQMPSNLPYVVNPNMMIVPMSFYKP